MFLAIIYGDLCAAIGVYVGDNSDTDETFGPLDGPEMDQAPQRVSTRPSASSAQTSQLCGLKSLSSLDSIDFYILNADL
jgi:hypothetical protein